MVTLFLVFKRNSVLFSIHAVPIHSPTNGVGGFPVLHSLQNSLFLLTFYNGILTRVRWYLIVVLIWSYPSFIDEKIQAKAGKWLLWIVVLGTRSIVAIIWKQWERLETVSWKKKKLLVDITLSETQGAFLGMASVSAKEMSKTAFEYYKQVCWWINESTSCLVADSISNDIWRPLIRNAF